MFAGPIATAVRFPACSACARFYNGLMVVVRYTALLGLVVWLGAMQTTIVAGAGLEPIWLQYVCGGVFIVCLFAMKFVGPPPRAFIPRVAIALVMLGLTAYGHRYAAPAATALSSALGFLSLMWYARE